MTRLGGGMGSKKSRKNPDAKPLGNTRSTKMGYLRKHGDNSPIKRRVDAAQVPEIFPELNDEELNEVVEEVFGTPVPEEEGADVSAEQES